VRRDVAGPLEELTLSELARFLERPDGIDLLGAEIHATGDGLEERFEHRKHSRIQAGSALDSGGPVDRGTQAYRGDTPLVPGCGRKFAVATGSVPGNASTQSRLSTLDVEPCRLQTSKIWW
jgi:hypothetical protein